MRRTLGRQKQKQIFGLIGCVCCAYVVVCFGRAKVRGFCIDKSNLDLFDRVDVRGNIINCNIHHMWYGMYSYGHIGGVWINNLVHGEPWMRGQNDKSGM